MAELIRVGMVLDSAGVVRGAREATQAFGSVRREVESMQLNTRELLAPLKQLEGQYRTGRITLLQYRDQLRTTVADLKSLANTTQMTAQQEAGLVVQTKAVEMALQQADRAALRTQNAMVRVAGGVQSLGFAMQGGRLSTMGLMAALGTLGIGSPVFIAIVAGLSAIGAIIASIDDKAESAARSLSGFNRGRLQGIVSRLEAKQAGTGATDPIGLAVARAGGRGGLLTPEEATELANARAELAAMDRSGRGRAGRVPAEARLGVRGITSKPGAIKGEDTLGGGHLDNMKASLDELKGLTKGFATERDNLLDIGSSLSAGLSAIGASLADGFKGIGKAILGIIGGMMQQIGHALIAFGLAGKAIRNFIKNPVAAVAAGAVLIVLGAALAKSAQGTVNRGGEGTGGSSGPYPGAPDGFGARSQTIIQIVGQRSGEVIAEHSYENARYLNRGGSSGTGQSAAVIPITGQVVVRRV